MLLQPCPADYFIYDQVFTVLILGTKVIVHKSKENKYSVL